MAVALALSCALALTLWAYIALAIHDRRVRRRTTKES